MPIIRRKKYLSKSMKEFTCMLDKFNMESSDDLLENSKICPPSTDPQLVVNCIHELLLGDKYRAYTALDMNQINTVILDELLYRYCDEYRDYCRRYKQSNFCTKSV